MKPNPPRLFQINVSDGGVPKLPVRSAEVTAFGVRGDRQRDTKHHGGPERAVCLYSLEHILALQAEGHPIYPGSIGENLTIAGIDWSEILSGIRIQVGEQVEIQITSYAVPCRNIQNSFDDQIFSRISPKTQPGWARAYAKVLIPGRIAIADPIKFLG
ncbi:MAG: MOSC domain-containing protein [Chloroflexota bacterium]|jgi:MOSC domain-containing protein YiiM